VYSNRICTDASHVATTSEATYGLTFGAKSRCFDTTGLIKSGYTGTTSKQSCLNVRCVNGVRLQVQVVASVWTNCPTSGAAGTISVTGYSGTVACPAASTFCGDTSLKYTTA
jgi:hypothetical protein